jgi:hypothetical protein
VGHHNGCGELKQFDHLIDRAHLCGPRVMHWEFYPVQIEAVLPIFNGRSQNRLMTTADQYRNLDKGREDEQELSYWFPPISAPEQVNWELFP